MNSRKGKRKTGTCGCQTHNLQRFVEAQKSDYALAAQELRRGMKCGHWIWYIFPQVSGLGNSATTEKYAIKSIDEARAYYEHPLLGPRLLTCTQLVIDVEERTTKEILGYTDSLKFRSCMTLFDCAVPDEGLFRQALRKFFDGEADQLTLEILKADP